jgi:hypothetical protein
MRKSIIVMLAAMVFVAFSATLTAQSVSVVISEPTVNDFLTAVGPVKGKGTGAQKISYSWTVTNPSVDFEPGTAGFKANIKVKTKIITFNDKVKGRLNVDYDAATNKIKMQVVEAKFAIRVKILGQKVKIATIDIGKYYQPKFEFNGPEPVQQEVEVDIGNGNTRLIQVTVGGRQIAMEKDQLRVSVDLAYTGAS